MEPDIKIFEPPYDKREFYGFMGDVFSMRDVRRELPYLYNEAGRVWFLAFYDGDLSGFGSLQERKNHVEILGGYVYPKYRQRGVYSRLVDRWLEYGARYKKPFKVVCRGDQVTSIYRRRGFAETRRSKNYCWMVKNVE